MQLNCQETDLTPPLNLRSNLFRMFSAQSRRMLSVGLLGKKEQKRERKRHFKYQMTHLMADIISPPDACWAPHLKLLTAAAETLHYSGTAPSFGPSQRVWLISAPKPGPAHRRAPVWIPESSRSN